MRFISLLNRASLMVAVVTMVGCGTMPSGQLVSTSTSQLSAESVPTPDQFVTIQCTVTKLLPDDTSGLPHQNFVVQETKPTAGLVLTVNNDTQYGSKVLGLTNGEKLEIRGVVYHDKNGSSGIHWTHKANKAGDAGYIQTPDGKIYQ